jgi:hypothetical protein
MTDPLCVARHHHYPDTLCTEPAGHYVRDRDPHAGPLIIDGRERGSAAWDEPEEQPVTDRKTASTINDAELDQLYERLERAEQELRHYTEAESADAAAGSYAGRAERAEAELDALRKRTLTQLGELGIAHHRLDRIRDAARLHRQYLIGTSELYAVIEALDGTEPPAT